MFKSSSRELLSLGNDDDIVRSISVPNSKLVMTYLSKKWPKPFSITTNSSGAPNDNFRQIICSEDDLRSRIFGSFSEKILACLPLLGFSNFKKSYNCPFLTDFYPKKVT